MNDPDPMEEQISTVVAEMHDMGLHQPRPFRESLDVSPENIQSEYTRIMNEFGYYLSVATEAHRDYLMAKASLENFRAKLFASTKRKLEDDGEKSGDKLVEQMVRADSRLEAKVQDVIEAQISREQTHNACTILSTKRDMLISLGAHVRTEMGGIPTLREAPDPEKGNWSS